MNHRTSLLSLSFVQIQLHPVQSVCGEVISLNSICAKMFYFSLGFYKTNVRFCHVAKHLPPIRNTASYFHATTLDNGVQIVFDFVFSMWVTHLVGTELKVCSGPYGTSAAGPCEQSAV